MFVLLANLAAAADLQVVDALSALDAERPTRKQTLLVVLHTTEGGDESAQRLVKLRGLANYLVLTNGTVQRIIDREREARHAGLSMWNGVEDIDSVSVGIEVVGYHDQPITPAQEESLSLLIADLKAAYGLEDVAVLSHAAVAYGAPNKWHTQRHRGRKRCGMLFATVYERARLGLTERAEEDPDVLAGRLVEADSELAAVLYGTPIASGQTAFQVVGEAFDDPKTVYVFPGGVSVRGDDVTNWSDIPAGTYVRLERRSD